MAGIVGYFNDRWDLHEAMAAVEAKRDDDWSRLGFALCWVVNSMPNFSKNRRPALPMHRFNPLMKAKKRLASETDRDASFDALWNACPEAPK